MALGAAIDVASASTTTFSLIPPSTGKELARTGPALIAAVCALALGVFAADRFVAAASSETVEAAKLTAQIRERIQSAQALSAELDQSVVRATSANKVWQLSAEWNAWEKATARALETLDPSAIVLRCSWERGEREIVGTITLALRCTVNASGEPVARDSGATSRLRSTWPISRSPRFWPIAPSTSGPSTPRRAPPPPPICINSSCACR